MNTKINNFKRELKTLLAKYNADIYVDLDGDTHGVTSAVVIDIENIEIMRKDSISQYDITGTEVENVVTEISDNTIENIICDLNKYSENYDPYEYGLPTHEPHITNMINIVKNHLK